jgi:hypothetical protein
MSPEFVRPPQIISSPGPKKFWWTFGWVFEGIALSGFIFWGNLQRRISQMVTPLTLAHMLPAVMFLHGRVSQTEKKLERDMFGGCPRNLVDPTQ